MRPDTARAIERALGAGDIAAAAALADGALVRGEVAPMLLNLAAWAREERGDLPGAHALLARALALAPGDPLILTGIGAVLRKQHRLDEALAVLDRAVAAFPRGPAAWLERGYALEEQGRAALAAESYGRASAADPACAPAFAGQASIAARNGDAAAARAQAARALALDPDNAIAHAALAASAIESGDAAGALDRLDVLLRQGALAPLDHVRALGLRGDALDRLDRTDEAFAAYEDANRAYAALHAPLFAGEGSHRAWIERLHADFLAADPARWDPLDDEAEEARPHLFLLGYPRSGTTLVENILASVPGVHAVEERPTLAAADRAFLLPPDGMARLAALDADGAAPFRADYRRVAGLGRPGRPFVDMDPLKSLRLPLIARLFPKARILFIRRDPRDVVWSCFRQNFRPSPANLEFTELERAARHYDAAMRFAEAARGALPIEVHDVDYAAVVRAFDATTRALCRFAGLPWSPELRRFDRTARRRGVTTSSATQVRAGLFDGGGRWRRYERQLAPVLPILAPWVERLGLE